MSDSEPFYARRRLKELRALIRATDDFGHECEVHDAMVSLLSDLANDLASRADGDRDDAYHFIIRCMGAVAEAEADHAYAPHGYANPFEGGASSPVEPLWKWPEVKPTGPGSGGFADGVLRDFSALKLFDYTVGEKGRKNGWSRGKRQAFLRDFMTVPLPPVVKAHFGDEYGAPLTTTRLRKVANVIASNASNFYRNNPTRFAVAISDWEADLDFLYREFYLGKRLAFEPWPSTRPA